MVSTPDVVGLAMTMVALPAIALLWLVRQHLDRAGARGFAVNVVGWAGWSAFVGLRVVTDTAALTFLMQNVALLFANVATLGWLLLAVEFTRRRRIRLTPLRTIPILVVPVVSIVLAFTNSLHELTWGPGSDVTSAGILVLDPGPVFLVDTLYMIALAEAALLLVAYEAYRSSAIHRRQAIAVAVGHLVTVPFAMDAWWPVRPFPYLDLSPVGFLLGSVIWAWALFRFDLLRLAPIARETAVETMSDPIIAVDENGATVDANPAATAAFDLPDELPAASFEEVFADHPPVLDLYRNGEREGEVSLLVDGENCHFQIECASVDRNGTTQGNILVFRDVSPLKAREEELDLLKQVLARVLRHNIRNDVAAIKSYGEVLAERLDDENAELAEYVVERSENLVSTSQKARHFETVAERDRERTERDLVAAITNAVERVGADAPDVTFETDLPAELTARADPEIDVALENLIENGAIHNDDPDPWVAVTARHEDGWATVEVTDNGPGIPGNEVAVLERNEERPLQHGSGVGLWLVDWLVRESGGDLSFDVHESGTTATVRLPRPEPT